MCLLSNLLGGKAQISVRPHERSLEALTETNGDETMMDNPGDDVAGETSAVKSKIQPNEAIG